MKKSIQCWPTRGRYFHRTKHCCFSCFGATRLFYSILILWICLCIFRTQLLTGFKSFKLFNVSWYTTGLLKFHLFSQVWAFGFPLTCSLPARSWEMNVRYQERKKMLLRQHYRDRRGGKKSKKNPNWIGQQDDWSSEWAAWLAYRAAGVFWQKAERSSKLKDHSNWPCLLHDQSGALGVEYRTKASGKSTESRRASWVAPLITFSCKVTGFKFQGSHFAVEISEVGNYFGLW